MLKVYENLSDLQFLKGAYAQSEYFHKKAFQTISKDDENRKIIMIILTFILIVIASAYSAAQHTM